MDSSSGPPWLERVHDWLGEQLPAHRRRYGLGALIIIGVLLLTQGAITVPFTVGWGAADTLVHTEAELELLLRETAECAAAAAYFRTPEGKRFARKLMYNQLEEGERRVVPDLPEAETEPRMSRRVGEWFHTNKDALTCGTRHKLAVLKRWMADPSEDVAEAAPLPDVSGQSPPSE